MQTFLSMLLRTGEKQIVKFDNRIGQNIGKAFQKGLKMARTLKTLEYASILLSLLIQCFWQIYKTKIHHFDTPTSSAYNLSTGWNFFMIFFQQVSNMVNLYRSRMNCTYYKIKKIGCFHAWAYSVGVSGEGVLQM